MELFVLYLWLKLDTINLLGQNLIPMAVICLGVLTFWFFVCTVENKPQYKPKKWLWFLATFLLSIGVFLSTVLPSSKQMAYLVGGHFALKAAETPEAAKIVQVLRKKANEFLDDQLKQK